MPATFNFSLYRGDSYKYRFKLWQDEAKTVPYDLTGGSVLAEARDKPGGAVIVTLTTDIVEPNFVDVTITPEMTKGALVKGEWDLELTLADGTVVTPIRGSWSITPDISGSTPPGP